MEVGDIRFYKERWKAVEEIERQELRALTPKRNWKHLNSIMRRAKRLGIRRGDDDGEWKFLSGGQKSENIMSQSDPLEPLLDALDALQHLLSRFDNKGVIIGGAAVSILGKARFTEDVEGFSMLFTYPG